MTDSKKDSPDNLPKKKTLASLAAEKVEVSTSIGSLYARRANSSDYVSLAGSSKDYLGELTVKLLVNGNKDKADKAALNDAEFELLSDEDITAVVAAIAKANGWIISNGDGIKGLGLSAGAAMKKRNADALARQKEWLDQIDKIINPPYMKVFDDVNKYKDLIDKMSGLNNPDITGLLGEMQSRDQMIDQINRAINPSIKIAVEEFQKREQDLSNAYSFLDADTIKRLTLSLDSIKSAGDEGRLALGSLWNHDASEAVRNHTINQNYAKINEYIEKNPNGFPLYSERESEFKPSMDEVIGCRESLSSPDWLDVRPTPMIIPEETVIGAAALEAAAHAKESAVNTEKLMLDVAELHAILIGKMIPKWLEAQEKSNIKAETDRAHAEASLSATQIGLELTQTGLGFTQRSLGLTKKGLYFAIYGTAITTFVSFATAYLQYWSSGETEQTNRAEAQAQIELLKSQLAASQELLIEFRQMRSEAEGNMPVDANANLPEVASDVDGLQE